MDVGPYFVRRLKRLYPPLLAAMAIGWISDTVGTRLGLPLYGTPSPYPLLTSVRAPGS